MIRYTLLLFVLVATACVPKNVKITDEADWRSEGGQERIRVQLIESLIERGNPREALLLIRTSRERGDNDLSLNLHQASALMMTGMSDEAERMLRTYLERRPRDERAWRKLGILQADQRRTEESISSLTRATELDDSHADTWNNLGFVLLSADRADEAVIALRRAISLDGTKVRYRNNLGFALAASGQPSDAMQAFMTGARPADAHANMGLAYERLGEVRAASEQYALALQYNPEHEASREALARLTTPSSETTP